MTTILKILAATVSALTLSGPMLAQATPDALPREGNVESTLCFSGPSSPLLTTETDRYGTYAVSGATQSENKAFDSMSTECVAAYELRSKVWQHRGYCVFQDPSGDQIHASDNSTINGGYRLVYLGGTGKFKGITGEAKVEPLGSNMKAVRPGTLVGCRRIKSSYKLP